MPDTSQDVPLKEFIEKLVIARFESADSALKVQAAALEKQEREFRVALKELVDWKGEVNRELSEARGSARTWVLIGGISVTLLNFLMHYVK